jgi:hypothetical protein
MRCPRCGKKVATCEALSRTDNETMVCSPCGRDEARVWYGAPASRARRGWNDATMSDYRKQLMKESTRRPLTEKEQQWLGAWLDRPGRGLMAQWALSTE